MPTKLPRVLVTLSVELHAAVARAAAASGTSKSAMIAGLLEPSAPVLHRMADVMEAAAAAPEEARQGMVRALDASLEGLLPVIQATTKLGTSELVRVAEIGAPAERAHRSPAPARRPRSPRTPA